MLIKNRIVYSLSIAMLVLTAACGADSDNGSNVLAGPVKPTPTPTPSRVHCGSSYVGYDKKNKVVREFPVYSDYGYAFCADYSVMRAAREACLRARRVDTCVWGNG